MPQPDNEKSMVPRPKGGPMQTRRFFIAGNPIMWAARGLARLEAGQAIQAASMGAKILEDPVKAAKVVDLASDLAVRVVDAFSNKSVMTKSIAEPEKSSEPENPSKPLWKADFERASEFLDHVELYQAESHSIDWETGKKIAETGVRIGEENGDVAVIVSKLDRWNLWNEAATVERAAGIFKDWRIRQAGAHYGWFGDNAEIAKFMAKRGLDVSAKLVELDRIYEVHRSAAYDPSQLADLASAHFYAGTGDYKKWIHEAEKALGSVPIEQAQGSRVMLALSEAECGDISRAYGTISMAAASSKEVMLANISASENIAMKLIKADKLDPDAIRLFAQLGLDNLFRFRRTYGEIDGTTHKYYHDGGEVVLFNLVRDFADSGGRYSFHNFLKSYYSIYTGGNRPTIIANRIHWIRFRRMLGEPFKHDEVLDNLLGDVWEVTKDEPRDNQVLAEGYKKAIEMQTDVGDLDEARITFAQMEERLSGENNDNLLAKADALARIGIAQKKKDASLVA